MRRASGLAALLWASSALAVAVPASGYLVPNNAGNPFEYYVDGRFPGGAGGVTQAAAATATQGAFQAWQDVACAWPAFSYKGLASANPAIVEPRDPYDTFNVAAVWINDPADPYYDFALAGGVAFAAALPLTYGGNVYQCDIYTNGVGLPFSAATPTPAALYDLQSSLLHEVGHCLGLGHSNDFHSIMFPVLDTGAQRRTLHQLDVDALCALYPQTGAVGSPCTPGAGCGAAGLSCIQPPLPGGGAGSAICTSGCTPGLNGACTAPWACKASTLVPGSPGACLPTYGDAITQVGKPCTQGTDCGSALAFCEEEAQLPSGAPAWKGGACAQLCGDGRPECPAGSGCADFGNGKLQCVQTCRLGTGDCREGYACVLVAQGYPALCLSACATDADCNGGAATGSYLCRTCDGLCVNRQAGAAGIGDTCTTTQDCGTGQVCARLTSGTETLGICSQTCADACSTCPGGTACHPVGEGAVPWCLRECDVGSCPAGQRCGLLPTGRACLPACTVDTECPVGLLCVGGECQSPEELDGGCLLCPKTDAGMPTGGTKHDGGTGSAGSGGGGGCGCTESGGLAAWLCGAWLLGARRRGRDP